MKTKKFVKKLTLSKGTVANVTTKHMGEIRGGDLTDIGSICDTTDCTRLILNCNTGYCLPSVPPIC